MSSPPRPSRGQLLAFLPPDVADRVLASEEDLLAGRRLEVSVLSCDVSGFRALVDSNPEEALAFLNGLLAEIAAAIAAELGTLMSFPGDGALAVFGAPLADPAHRERADRAAAAISGRVIAAAQARLRAAGMPAVGIDVAVESGPVLAGMIGAEPRWEYAAIGEATSRAVARTTG
jgi:adenylate cyclase